MRTLSAVLALPLLAAAMLSRRLVRRYKVTGESMMPAYKPGERLIAENLTYRLRPPRASEVVIVRQPGGGGRIDLKRIAAGPGSPVTILGERRLLAGDEWFVLGDNLDASTDSRVLGPVKRHDILGRVWIKY